MVGQSAKCHGMQMTLDWFDHEMRHIKPLAAPEVQKGLETGVRLELTPFDFPVVDEP